MKNAADLIKIWSPYMPLLNFTLANIVKQLCVQRPRDNSITMETVTFDLHAAFRDII